LSLTLAETIGKRSKAEGLGEMEEREGWKPSPFQGRHLEYEMRGRTGLRSHLTM